MSPTSVGLWLAGFGLAFVYAAWIYRRRELVVSGSTFLSVIRALVLGLVLLLLLNPTLPWGAAGLSRGAWVLVDRSASMAATGSDPESAWTRAVQRADRLLPADGKVVLFDDRAVVADADDLDGQGPQGPASRLTRAVELAAEAGVTQAVVVSDLRIQDLANALTRADALGVQLGFEDVGSPLVNVGVLEIDLPDRVEASDTFSVGVALFGEGSGSDSVHVEVRREGALVGSASARRPSYGETERLRIPLPPPGAEEPAQSGIRYAVRATVNGDGFSEDDERVGFVRTGDEVGGLILVSDAPDWEPRFLLPVLAQVTGLEAVAYLRVGPDQWKPVTDHQNRSVAVSGETVQRRLGSAELIVVHALSDRSPAWLNEVVPQKGRVLLLPATAEGTTPLGIQSRNRSFGEWYVVSPPPASPVAALLGDVDFSDLPPLTSMLPLMDDVGRPVLNARVGSAGAVQPAMVLVEAGGRRTALATGAGFWRWALRGGESRTAYRRLWSAVVGWVMGARQLRSAGDVRPARTVSAAGEAIRWIAPSRAGDSLSIRIETDAGSFGDTAVHVLPDERFRTSALEPGGYRYQAMDAEGQGVGSGRLDVERWSDELLTGPGVPDSIQTGGDGVADRLVAGFRVRTHPIPYLILIVLLAVEWIGRRRRGLR